MIHDRLDWRIQVNKHLKGMGLTEEAREAVIDKHRTAGTMNAMNSQWKRWHIWVAESVPTADQEIYSEEWQG